MFSSESSLRRNSTQRISGELRDHSSLTLKSGPLFHSQFYVRFGLFYASFWVCENFYMTTILLITLKHCKLIACVLLMSILCAHRRIKYVGKISLWNSKRLLRKRHLNGTKNLRMGNILLHPVYSENAVVRHCSVLVLGYTHAIAKWDSTLESLTACSG